LDTKEVVQMLMRFDPFRAVLVATNTSSSSR
jgi:hypothetical protein